MPGQPRVALTLEQCWHRVPGGTAVAAVAAAAAVRDLGGCRLVGVAARHRRAPPAAFSPPIPVAQLPLPRLALYEAWHRARRPAVQRATGPVDLVHATTLAIPPKSAPLVVTMHDLAFLHDPAHFTRRGVGFFRRGLALARRDADLVLCPSRATLEDCATHGFSRDRLRLVPHGVTPPPVRPEDIARLRRTYGLGRPYVLWTGTLEPRKNVAGLLTAFAELPEGIDLVLAGPRGWNEQPMQLARGGRVRLLGFVAGTELAALYAGAAVFCFPSLREGFGLPVLEAMAQGTPVVTSAGTSMAEFVGGGGLLVDPLDPAAIAKGLLAVLDDPARATTLGQAGRAIAAGYTWRAAAAATVAAYRSLAP